MQHKESSLSLEMLELDVQALSHDGRAVCRDGQRVIFVRGGLPGQRILVRVTHAKKTFAEGVREAIITPAPDAIAAPCPHAQLCGGCPLQEMPSERQLYWKEHFVRDSLARIGKISDAPVEAIIPSPRSWGYRNKMEFSFGPAPLGKEGAHGEAGGHSGLALGLRHSGSHTVCDTRHCLLLPEGGMEALDALRQLTAASGLPAWNAGDYDAETTDTPSSAGSGFWRFAVLRMPETPLPEEWGGNKQLLINCITATGNTEERAKVKALGQELMRRVPAVTGFVHEERRAPSMLAQGERTVCTLGRIKLHERLGGMNFIMDHASFFQVNTGAAEHLCDLAKDMAALYNAAENKTLWDLYCGVGAPGLCMAAKATALHGVEYTPSAVEMAKRNAATAGFSHCHYVEGDVRLRMKGLPKPHTVLLDPPRAGLHPDIIKELLRVKPRRIVYISCNPATLARDVALMAQGYKLSRVVPVDMFPQTPHVESVSLLLPA